MIVNKMAVGLTCTAGVLLWFSAPLAISAPLPKVTMGQAKMFAVKKIPGKPLSAKYEFEDGRWQYAVVVQNKEGQLYEIEVNSTTGKIMDTEKTSTAEEAKEAAADKKAAAKAK